MTRQNLLA